MLRPAVARPLPRWAKALAAATVLFAHVYAIETRVHWFNPNQISRMHLTLAVLSERRFVIDRYLRMVETEDKSTYRGHFFTDKAPGTSVWLVPFAWMLNRKNRRACVLCPRIAIWRPW